MLLFWHQHSTTLPTHASFFICRYFEHYPKFYLLIMTLRRGLTNVARFLVGCLPVFFGYALMGNILFGSYARYVSSTFSIALYPPHPFSLIPLYSFPRLTLLAFLSFVCLTEMLCMIRSIWCMRTAWLCSSSHVSICTHSWLCLSMPF